MTSLSANALMTPVQLCLVRACVPGPCGALRWASYVRDFSGLGTWSPEIIFIAGDQVSFLISFARAGGFLTCTDARESVQILEENLAPV